MMYCGSAEQLEEIIAKAEVPVFCDFYANWCGPCKMIAPIFEGLAEKYHGQAYFVKVDVDEEANEPAAVKYGISAIPNIIVFKGGKQVDNVVGFLNEEDFERFIEEHL